MAMRVVSDRSRQTDASVETVAQVYASTQQTSAST